MKSILVIGETCKDIFVYCNAIRLAPDLPVPVLEVERTTENPGMAMNVQRNIHKIFEKCDLVTNHDWQQVTKTRYIHSSTNHMFIRIDTPHVIPRIDLKNINLDYSMIVISDYDKGFLSKEDISEISKSHPLVLLDTKKPLASWAENCKYIKINDYEFERSKPFLNENLEQRIIHTKGGEGAFFRDEHFQVTEAEVRDASGAGDAFMAALAVKFLETLDIREGIKYANVCASRVVGEKGVTTLTK